MKLYITADWHLAEGAWKSRPEIAGDAFESLIKLNCQCKLLNEFNGELETVILAAGDLFDTKHPTASTINKACNILRPRQTTQQYVLFIQGQHEYAEDPWLNVADGMHVDYKRRIANGLPPYQKLSDKPNGIVIWAMDWTLSLHLQTRLDEIGELFAKFKQANPNTYNILMLHQTCNAVTAGTEDDRDRVLSSLDFRACELNDGMLPHGFDLAVVGDTHFHTEFTLLDKKGNKVRCLSPGSFAMQSISETNTGQCFVLDCDTKEITEQELYRRDFEERKITNPIDWDKEIREIIKSPNIVHQLSIPIVRFTVYENDAARITALKQACVGKIHPFFNILASDIEEAEIEAGKTESVDELITSAIQEYEASDTAKELLISLLANNSPDETLTEYYKEMVLR